MKPVMQNQTDLKRRNLMKWTAPMVVAISLPQHAHATQGGTNNSRPVARLTRKPICKSAPVISSSAVISIFSDNEEMVVESISHNAPSTDTILLPGLPATVDQTNGIDIGWSGLSLSAKTCLPISDVTFVITYNSNDDQDGPFTTEIHLSDVLGGTSAGARQELSVEEVRPVQQPESLSKPKPQPEPDTSSLEPPSVPEQQIESVFDQRNT